MLFENCWIGVVVGEWIWLVVLDWVAVELVRVEMMFVLVAAVAAAGPGLLVELEQKVQVVHWQLEETGIAAAHFEWQIEAEMKMLLALVQLQQQETATAAVMTLHFQKHYYSIMVQPNNYCSWS